MTGDAALRGESSVFAAFGKGFSGDFSLIRSVLEKPSPGAVQCWLSPTSRFVGWSTCFAFSPAERSRNLQPTNFFMTLQRGHNDAIQESAYMEEQAAVVVEASTEYVGRWNRLVSTTNLEKGRIISEWRAALQQADAPAVSYTDDAWSQQVGGVTPQHVGRLRRVYERFGEAHEQYPRLYWSHFQAASIGPMPKCICKAPSKAIGRSPRCAISVGKQSAASRSCSRTRPILSHPSWTKTFLPATIANLPPEISESIAEVHGTDDFSEYDDSEAALFDNTSSASDAMGASVDAPSAPLLRPFESLPPLPADLKEAFELMKLAILAHKVCGWAEIARDDVLSMLESLKQLALAPAE